MTKVLIGSGGDVAINTTTSKIQIIPVGDTASDCTCCGGCTNDDCADGLTAVEAEIVISMPSTVTLYGDGINIGKKIEYYGLDVFNGTYYSTRADDCTWFDVLNTQDITYRYWSSAASIDTNPSSTQYNCPTFSGTPTLRTISFDLAIAWSGDTAEQMQINVGALAKSFPASPWNSFPHNAVQTTLTNPLFFPAQLAICTETVTPGSYGDPTVASSNRKAELYSDYSTPELCTGATDTSGGNSFAPTVTLTWV